ncbi:acyl carrier protein [Luteimonas mephitis]|uniref:acyl carrier protein n=1 Tax=Luteimonas mephitis TaxID=83615 RepID=UPI003A93F02B
MEEVSMESNENRIREFVGSNFPPLSADEMYSDTQSLLEAGAIDSMGVLTLVTWLEQEFGFVVDDEDVVPENLDSIASITAYVDRKLAEPGLV